MRRLFNLTLIGILMLAFTGAGRLGEGNAQSQLSSIVTERKQDAEPDVSTKSSLFVDLHQNVILGNCALPACHDGSFEPNFTTIQSSYYTLVFHPVKKNSPLGIFEYRVVPGDTARSVLYQRITDCCFVDDGDKMPLLGLELSQGQIDSIGLWISEGAPDWNGGFPWKQR